MKLFHIIFIFALLSGTYSIAQSNDPVKDAKKAIEKYKKSLAKVVNEAESYVGTRYKIEGKTKKGIDETNLTRNVFKTVGVNLPAKLSAQSKVGQRVYIGEVKVGDLVFFALSSGSKKISSAGIVVKVDKGNVYFIQCSSIEGVKKYKLNDDKWKERYIQATRVLNEPM